MLMLVARRLAQALLAVWGIASLVFLLSHHDPSSIDQLLLSDTANKNSYGTSQITTQPAARQAIRHRLGLDQALFYLSRLPATATTPGQWQWHGVPNQYHTWITGLTRGKLGHSYRTGEAVHLQLRTALAYTVPLVGSAALLAFLLALGLAQHLATRPRYWPALQAVLLGIQSLPLFVVALALLLLFANPEMLDWFPAYGLYNHNEADAASWTNAASVAAHFVLPVASLVLTVLPALTLQLEAALSQELQADYATTARAKGLGESQVIRRHALRNALLPSISQITDLLPALLTGSVLVEVIFALPGMGRLLAAAAVTRDYPILVGSVLLIGTARVLSLLAADLLYLWLDPRIRWQQ
jgi:peptide/nickel transport system permease protein